MQVLTEGLQRYKHNFQNEEDTFEKEGEGKRYMCCGIAKLRVIVVLCALLTRLFPDEYNIGVQS